MAKKYGIPISVFCVVLLLLFSAFRFININDVANMASYHATKQVFEVSLNRNLSSFEKMQTIRNPIFEVSLNRDLSSFKQMQTNKMRVIIPLFLVALLYYVQSIERRNLWKQHLALAARIFTIGVNMHYSAPA